ncbi:PKD domain-containing protein, partial [Winogradskyella sp.]|uniref:PKD domain-containing protein n=1 Tax=Winogradskyella sp. TaxID=1883156 RepID=UPI002615E863
MKNKLLALITILITSIGFSQDLNMQNGTFNQCSGTFYDSGGEFGQYGNNENLVLTICPDTPGFMVQLNFDFFATQAGADTMSIYNGDDTTATLLGTYDGVNNPGFVTATPAINPSGCLTIEFTSDGAAATPGWEATISCLEPCQNITAQIDNTIPAADMDGAIKVCPGDDITFTGGGIFSDDPTGATYEWDFGDNTTDSGQTVVHSYDTPGVYLVNLIVRDDNFSADPQGCSSNNVLDQIIQVGTEPDFSVTQAANSTLCYGESTTITGSAMPTEFIFDCTPAVGSQTSLPDGNGVSYTSGTIVENCYDDSEVIVDGSQIASVCLNIEHSFSGDLDIFLESPSGVQVQLFAQAGGGIYFGGADNNDNGVPGVGADYCFSMDATTLLQNANTVIAGSNPPNNSWEPGTYLPVGNFDDFIGSPINGDWTIIITDNIPVDDGTIFFWSLEFDPSLQPPLLSFTPTITSEAWDADPTITNTTGNVITVTPPDAGQYCYTYRVTDDFGCEYTEEVCIDVLPELITELPNNLVICDPGSAPYIFDLEINTPIVTASAPNAGDLVVTYHNSQLDAENDVGEIVDTNNYSGTDGETIYVRIEYLTSGCNEVFPFTLGLSGQPVINPVGNLELCDDGLNDGTELFNLESQTLGILGAQNPSDFEVTYHLSFADADGDVGALSSPFPNTINPQPIFVRVESIGDSSCYNASVNAVFNLIVNPSDDSSFNITPTCDGATINITGTVGGTFTFNPVPTDAAVIDVNTGEVTGGTSGTSYTIEYTTNGICPSTSSQTFSVLTLDDATFNLNPSCDGGTATVTGTIGGIFTFEPDPMDGSVIDTGTGEVTGAQPGASYTIRYTTTGVCPSSSTEILTVLTFDDPSFIMTATCDGGTATVTGDAGGTFAFNPIPTDAAVIDAATGTVTNGVSGTTYTVEYTTSGACPQFSTQDVTVIDADDASFTVTPTCDGGTVTLTGTPGGVFTFVVLPTDSAVIDPVTGEVTGGTPGTTYTISYTTSGVCSETQSLDFDTLAIDDASFTVAPTCDGGLVTLTGTMGGTFSFNPLPPDAAVIDINTGDVTNGTPGETYTIEYITTGVCPNSSSVEFTVHPLPVFAEPDPLEVCDDGVPDGLTSIDLTLRSGDISGNNPVYSVSYYLTQGDAELGQGALGIPY